MRPRSRDKKLQEEWTIPLKSLEDVNERFMNYCLGKLRSSPWSELDGLQPETKIIDANLANVNLKGFLPSITSLHSVIGVMSDSPAVGWGGPGGYVYQKSCLEFFCLREKLDLLMEKCTALASVTYIPVNKEGQCVSNGGPTAVNAVTWGVFPAKEIIQPTVVDPASFMIWKDEAFEIWTRGWAHMFPEGDPSRELLELVQKTYFLVSLVDNDCINSDVFAAFKDI